MTEHRKETRYQTQAKARIEGVKEEKILLNDLSKTGCRIECPSIEELELNTRYKMEIIPEDAAKIECFSLLVESKWMKVGGVLYQVGFAIIESPKGEQFQHYEKHLSWLSSQGSSTKGHLHEVPHME